LTKNYKKKKQQRARYQNDDEQFELQPVKSPPFHPSAKLATLQVKPKTVAQKDYLDAIDQNDMVFSIGPAGTGKTFLAVAKAAQWLAKKDHRLVLVRPAVEAGEKLGFLPGTMQEKVDPYLRPIYDALNTFLPPQLFEKYLEEEIIEVAPLAFMRGRSLKNSFVILDEAQNSTPEQMFMMLTRMDENSKFVINGDITQIDLPKGQTSGLDVAEQALADVDGVFFHYFEEADIVRHPLVQRICNAWQTWKEEQQ
jgi:phosphate starvation-inducible PhoH-like protein